MISLLWSRIDLAFLRVQGFFAFVGEVVGPDMDPAWGGATWSSFSSRLEG